MTDSLGDLLSRPGLGRIFFKEVTLWRSNKYYRVDKPDMFHRDFGLSPIVRLTPRLRWVPSSKYHWRRRIRTLVQTSRWLSPPAVGAMSLKGLEGETLTMPDLVRIHYHFSDWERAWRGHLRYAVLEAIQFNKKLHDVEEIVNWATARLDETGLELAPVQPEWGVL